jgi:hypothetical protein
MEAGLPSLRTDRHPTPSSHPADRFAITQQGSIGGEPAQPLPGGLGHQQTIKRGAMNPGQMLHPQHVLDLDRQFPELLLQQPHPQGRASLCVV